MLSPVKLALAAAACVAISAFPPQMAMAIDFSDVTSDYSAGEVEAEGESDVATTKAPCPTLVQPTEAPTAAPVETTATPVETTATPVETTAAPVSKSPCPSLPQPAESDSGSGDYTITKAPCPSLPQASKTPCPSLEQATKTPCPSLQQASDSGSGDVGSSSASFLAVSSGVTVAIVASTAAMLAV